MFVDQTAVVFQYECIYLINLFMTHLKRYTIPLEPFYLKIVRNFGEVEMI